MVTGQVKAGRARIVGISSSKRLMGEFAEIPTLAEQGMDASLSSWRGIYAPQGITPAQVGYWESVLSRMVATEEWKKALEAAQWAPYYLQGEEAARHMDAYYKVMRSVMGDLGLLK